MLSLVVIFGLCASYIADTVFTAWLLGLTPPRFSARAFISIPLVGICVILAYVLAYAISDVELGNRLQHAFGGGFTAFLAYFLGVSDTNLDFKGVRFAALGLLIVTAMGVGNEILEFVIQTHSHLIFADNTLDTWRDLTSNLIGAVIAAIVLTPLLKSKTN